MSISIEIFPPRQRYYICNAASIIENTDFVAA